MTSTELYPNWTIATTPSTPPEISRRVSAALLAMKPIQHDLHWSVATDFTKVDNLFLNLRVGPYEYLREFNLARFMKEYWGYFALVGLLALGLILHTIRVNALVIKRTAQLSESLKREKTLAKEARMIRSRLNQIETAGLITQLGAMIAHELKQPLATASNYCFSLRRRAENNELSVPILQISLEKINKQLQKASGVIDRVRSYAKGERRRTLNDLSILTKKTITDVQKSFPDQAVLKLQVDEGDFITEVDEVEFQVVLLNLINNAQDAVSSVKDPHITVSLGTRDDSIRLSVTDNGPRLSDKDWEKLENNTQKTTKQNGLGFGLRIVRSITEDAGGKLLFSRGEEDGLTATVIYPVVRNGK